MRRRRFGGDGVQNRLNNCVHVANLLARKDRPVWLTAS
jgi:hypothetical protein